MRRFLFVALLLIACRADCAFAVSSAIGLNDFSGGETVISFNSIADEQLITTQYAGQGVTFGGALYGMTNLSDLVLFPNHGGVIASNWLYSQFAHQGTSFTAMFNSVKHRVGFHTETNFPDDTRIQVALGGNPQGSIDFDTSLAVRFIGLQDLGGFNSITVTVFGPDNNFIAIDDFRFEAVPEPAAACLALAALFAWPALCPRRTRR